MSLRETTIRSKLSGRSLTGYSEFDDELCTTVDVVPDFDAGLVGITNVDTDADEYVVDESISVTATVINDNPAEYPVDVTVEFSFDGTMYDETTQTVAGGGEIDFSGEVIADTAGDGIDVCAEITDVSVSD